MKLYNTLSRTIETFTPLNAPKVTFYSCGPTVYDYTHIGHIRTFVYNDLLKRTLSYNDYDVNHVMNITDVGHLSGDDDSGEDKMEKGAKKYGKTVWEVAQFYTDFFLQTIKAVNIIFPTTLCRATDNIPQMIDVVKKLVEKGHTYETNEAVYFDVATFNKYGFLSHQNLDEKLKGAREEVYVDPQKKHPADFALWFKRVGRFKDHTMHWDSPWGKGFPGWHVECSAMSMRYLGKTIDIHTGGIDHIPVHHENEIAQSEGANEVPFVNYWVHFYFLLVDGKKMSKSLQNFYTIEDLKKHHIDPLALRFLFLQTHYRQSMNFTWESVKAAQEGLTKIKDLIKNFKLQVTNYKLQTNNKRHSTKNDELRYKRQFKEFISNDLQSPQAIAVMWDMLKSDIAPQAKLKLIADFDSVLGLKLLESEEVSIPEEVIILAEKRKKAKSEKNFALADSLR